MAFQDYTGVLFKDKAGRLSVHTYTNYGMYLSTRPQVDPPKAKTIYVDIPGADGKLDLTEAVTGEVAYENRKLTFDFVVESDDSNRANLMTQVNSDLHGKVLRAIIDGDTDYYYEGRVSVAWDKISPWKLHCIITVDASPYKMQAYSWPISLTNNDVRANDPLIMPVNDWHDYGRETNSVATQQEIRFGTQENPNGAFYGWEWMELVFEDDQPVGNTVVVRAEDSDGHYWSHTTNVISRNNPATGVYDTLVNYSITTARDNGVSPGKIWRVTIAPDLHTQGSTFPGYIGGVNAKITSNYAWASINTDMPVNPDVKIQTVATNGYYLYWNEKCYNSQAFTGTGAIFRGTDSRLRIRRGTNIIAMRPRDTTVDNNFTAQILRGVL